MQPARDARGLDASSVRCLIRLVPCSRVQVTRGGTQLEGHFKIRVGTSAISFTFTPDRQRNSLRPGDKIDVACPGGWTKQFEVPAINVCALRVQYEGVVKPEVCMRAYSRQLVYEPRMVRR